MIYREHTLEDELENVNENYIVSSLVKGLRILSVFTVEQPALKVSEIADITGFDQATVFRFVYTLEKLGYLIRDQDTKRYRQSVKMLTIGLPARTGITVRHVALPVMSELSKRINETVKLAILDGVDIVIMGVVEVMDKLVYPTPIGYRVPAYCTALGKVLLAYQPLESWDRMISSIEFTPRTTQTIADPKAFREELVKICQQGFSIQDEELVVGFGSVAAPIFNEDGAISGAINISGLSQLILTEEKRGGYINDLQESARAISAKLGYIPK